MLHDEALGTDFVCAGNF